jgi:hypothetical protein
LRCLWCFLRCWLDLKFASPQVPSQDNAQLGIWVWVKIRYPNNWMVNTKPD